MNLRIASIGAVLIGWFAISSQSWASISVPEIDATGALTGLAVLAGALAVVAERRRQR
jgi:hypothetical protein